MKRLWRWLTYKRVLIVYNANYIPTSEIARLQVALERMRVDALALRVWNNEPECVVHCLDALNRVDWAWLRAEIVRFAHPPMMFDPGKAVEFTDSFKSYTPGQMMSSVDMAVEAFRTGKYRTPTPDEVAQKLAAHEATQQQSVIKPFANVEPYGTPEAVIDPKELL